MKRKGIRIFLAVLILGYLAAAAVPLLAVWSTEGKKPSQNKAQKIGAEGFRLEDADGTILEVSDEEFVRGGIAAEVPPTWEPAALEAQGVALYTYYSRLREQNRESGGEGADFSCDTQNALVYLPEELRKERWGDKFEEYEAVLEKAEKAVRGKTLQKDGELVCTTYFAISSGNTDAGGDIWGGDDACLQPAASPGDIFADGYLSQAEMTVNEVKEALARLCPEEKLGDDPDAWMAKLERTGSGTVRSGMVGNTQVTGTELRNAFGLRSANFTFEIEKGKFLFTVRGWGHNVGMSQNGAQYMAQNGADYQEILAWYYPGSELV